MIQIAKAKHASVTERSSVAERSRSPEVVSLYPVTSAPLSDRVALVSAAQLRIPLSTLLSHRKAWALSGTRSLCDPETLISQVWTSTMSLCRDCIKVTEKSKLYSMMSKQLKRRNNE